MLTTSAGVGLSPPRRGQEAPVFFYILKSDIPFCFPITIGIKPANAILNAVTWCFSDRASWIDYILITNLMHWLLFIHKILFSSTCFEPQVLIFRRIKLYTCSKWYCHSLWELWWPVGTQLEWELCVYRQATRNSRREWQYHMLHVYNCILLKMSTWGSKHVEEINILWINNNQCSKLVINIQGVSKVTIYLEK